MKRLVALLPAFFFTRASWLFLAIAVSPALADEIDREVCGGIAAESEYFAKSRDRGVPLSTVVEQLKEHAGKSGPMRDDRQKLLPFKIERTMKIYTEGKTPAAAYADDYRKCQQDVRDSKNAKK